MDVLTDLREKETITTGEGLTAAKFIAEKYIGVLGNVIRIKKEVPAAAAGGDSFRRAKPSNTELLEEVMQILLDFEHELNSIEAKLLEEH